MPLTACSVQYLLITIYSDVTFLQVDDELEIKAYYAGHVLGAAMFYMKVGKQSIVYTVSLLLRLPHPHPYPHRPPYYIVVSSL